MTTAEEILGIPFYPHECGSMIECITKQDAIKAVNQARIEAIRECAEAAKSEWVRWGTNMGHQVEKQTILNLIEEVK